MPTNSADRYRRWFEYEKDSHAKVLASLDAVPAPLRSLPQFQKAADLLAHLMMARQLWLFRFGILKEGPHEFFPQGMSLADLAARVREIEAVWSDYFQRLTDEEVARTFEYRSLEGDWYRNTVEDILTQLFGHSCYHRGQIAALIRSIGAEPAETDFVFWAREPIPPRE
ncbi:MAG TPA: DinB family protein [Blastocatellia bacterium]|nr:DinB family protein [Blastocatellia bacterium]